MVDAAVLVIWAGHTPHAAIQRALDAIGRDRVIGAVLNRVPGSDVSARYGGYSSYYYASGVKEEAPAESSR
jgi:hypothetical protein